MPEDPVVDRRTVLAGAAALGSLALAGCGSSAKDAAPNAAGSASSQPAGSGSGGGAALARVADIPDGEAISAKGAGGAPIILTRSGKAVTALSAKCTHRGCTVAPNGKELDCPCHGSVYDLTGKVLKSANNNSNPGQAPLPPVAVKVVGGEVLPA